MQGRNIEKMKRKKPNKKSDSTRRERKVTRASKGTDFEEEK